MTKICWFATSLLGVGLLLAGASPLPVQTSSGTASRQAQRGSLLVRTDLDCEWQVDGQRKGILRVDDRLKTDVPPGQHLIEAKAVDGADVWEKIVDVGEDRSVVVSITIGAERRARLVWTDSDTGLHWTRLTSDSVLEWDKAQRYCASMKTAGITGWRLPTWEELDGINPIDGNRPAEEDEQAKMKGPIQIPSGEGEWKAVWTDREPVNDDDTYGFRFNDRMRFFAKGNLFVPLKVHCVAGEAK